MHAQYSFSDDPYTHYFNTRAGHTPRSPDWQRIGRRRLPSRNRNTVNRSRGFRFIEAAQEVCWKYLISLLSGTRGRNTAQSPSPQLSIVQLIIIPTGHRYRRRGSVHVVRDSCKTASRGPHHFSRRQKVV